MGQGLCLGHSTNSSSVMYPELATGVARRFMTVQDLKIPDPGIGPDGLHAAMAAEVVSKNQIPSPIEDRGSRIEDGGLMFQRLPNPQSSILDLRSSILQAGSPSVGLTAFGFTLADFSGERLTLTLSRSNRSEP